MIDGKAIATVYSTENYDQFVLMKENRAIKGARIAKVRKSIEKNGYVFNPIIVNEKMEIIDGQARFEVLREKGLPIQFIVKEGLGARECIALNTTVSVWTIKDYVESYMNQGSKDYERLWYLLDKYSTYGINCMDLMFAIHGQASVPMNAIKDGEFVCSEEQQEEADKLLNQLRLFMPSMQRAKKGKTQLMDIAIMFVLRMELAKCKKLLEKFDKYIGSEIAPHFTTQDGAFETLDAVYNYKASTKVHWGIDYEKYQMGKYSWYKAKYGKHGDEVEHEQA